MLDCMADVTDTFTTPTLHFAADAETSDIRSQKTALTFPCALFKLPVGNVLHWKCTAVSIFNRFEMIC